MTSKRPILLGVLSSVALFSVYLALAAHCERRDAIRIERLVELNTVRIGQVAAIHAQIEGELANVSALIGDNPRGSIGQVRVNIARVARLTAKQRTVLEEILKDAPVRRDARGWLNVRLRDQYLLHLRQIRLCQHESSIICFSTERVLATLRKGGKA